MKGFESMHVSIKYTIYGMLGQVCAGWISIPLLPSTSAYLFIIIICPVFHNVVCANKNTKAFVAPVVHRSHDLIVDSVIQHSLTYPPHVEDCTYIFLQRDENNPLSRPSK